MTGLRYSQPKFRVTLVVAAAMTAMVSITLWMLMNAFGAIHADFYAILSAFVFFAFVSAAMLVRYLRNEVVLAVRPTGLYDARWRAEAVPWEMIREIVARRKENEVELDVYLWRPQRKDSAGKALSPDHVIELAPLEAGAEELMATLARHVTLRFENPADGRRLDGLARVEG